VFIPVLLGAGVILSLLAHIVERLALATGKPALEHRLAARLHSISLPPSGLLTPAPGAPSSARDAAPAGQPIGSRVFALVVALLGIFGTIQAIDLIGDATQSRVEPAPTGRSTELTFEVQTRGWVADQDATADALWVTCRNILYRHIDGNEIVPIGPGTYRVLVTPAMGEHGRRRLEGCIEDAVLDRTVGRVVSFVEVPAPGR
jgi:hypothetical protein